MSQDFVAIESVLLDFLRSSDWGLKDGTIDNYLHEAAQADNPPSGKVYPMTRKISSCPGSWQNRVNGLGMPIREAIQSVNA